MSPKRKHKRPVSPKQGAAGASGSRQQDGEGKGQGDKEVVAQRRQVIKAPLRGLVDLISAQLKLTLLWRRSTSA
ncbi:hypothetical protein HaLaN_18236 [Haematococcus lacustris]|uniref:Uncharacterized protein n=1 Tax=Haematococcus lacustris TaxID=44745 RepID=A0A699ZRI0_HAELA|nr:hypothetical protein HaLaN_18236 [Haematococcus lacustris]